MFKVEEQEKQDTSITVLFAAGFILISAWYTVLS
jgi:hypothetical protein